MSTEYLAYTEVETRMAGRRRSDSVEDNRAKLVGAARKAFASEGFAASSMDELTAAVGLTRGALYHGFGDKRGLLGAVVAQIDGEMATRAQLAGAAAGGGWEGLLAEGAAYIGMALDPEVRRVVLLDGPAFLGDPARWPSQNACLRVTSETVAGLIANGAMKPIDVEAAARLLNGAALNAALWVASSEDPRSTLPLAIEAFQLMAMGFAALPEDRS